MFIIFFKLINRNPECLTSQLMDNESNNNNENNSTSETIMLTEDELDVLAKLYNLPWQPQNNRRMRFI